MTNLCKTNYFTLLMENRLMTTTNRVLLSALTGTALAAGSANAALVAHYTFDNADIIGTAAQNDQTANNNDSNEPTGATTGVAGAFGEAYNFTTTGLITVGSGVVPSGSSARTISVWFNQDVDLAGKQNKLFGYGTNSAGEALDIGFEGGGVLLRHFGGNITYGSGFDFDGTDAGWHHLALRVNSSASTFADVDVFLDGVKLSVTATGGGGTGVSINTAASVFALGGTTVPTVTSDHYFDGSVDELKIFSNALTDGEVAALAVVPEPGSLALLGLGGLLIAQRRRRA